MAIPVELRRILAFLLGTPVTLRGDTAGRILGRKIARKAVKRMFGMDSGKSAAEPHPVLAKLAFLNTMTKVAAFKSEAQRRKFYAMAERGEISKETLEEWERDTPDKKLPERVEKKAVAQYLPFLSMVPGKSGLSRAARTVGAVSFPGLALADGIKKAPPSHAKMSSLADRLIAIVKV